MWFCPASRPVSMLPSRSPLTGLFASCFFVCLPTAVAHNHTSPAGGDEEFAKAVGGASLTPGGMVSIKSSGGGSKQAAAAAADDDGAGGGGASLYRKGDRKHKHKHQGGGSSKKHKKH